MTKRQTFLSRGGIILSAGELFGSGDSIDEFARLIHLIASERMWEGWFDTDRDIEMSCPSFVAYVEGRPPYGLGTTMERVRNLCRDNLEAMDAITEAEKGEHGGDRGNQHTGGKVDNVHLGRSRPDGNSRPRALRRLRHHRPDLHARVLAEELSPHAAMVEAGFRQRTLSVPIHDVERTAAALRRNMTPEALERLAALLREVAP